MFVFPDVGTGGALQPNLASIVGYVPAGYNMLSVPGATQNYQTDWTDFSNTRNYSVTGSEAGTTPAQLTLVTGLSGPDSSAHVTNLVETTYNGNHSVVSFGGPNVIVVSWDPLDAPIPTRLAAICKASGRTRVVLNFGEGNTNGTQYQVSVGYDLAGGNTGYDTVVGTNMTLIGTHMTSLGNGWWLCYFDFYISSGALTPLTLANHNWQPTILLDNGSGTGARSTSYVGDVTKSVEVLWFNWLPTAMWNMTVKAFEDDFTSLSTIDLTNSKAPGFKWYINNHFPNSGNWASFWNVPGVTIPSNPANFSQVSPSVLQVQEIGVGSSPGFTNQLWSVVSNSNTPGTVPGFIGQAFSAPMLMEMSFAHGDRFTWPYSNEYFAGSCPQFWGSMMTTLTDVGWAADGGFRFVETDVIEQQSSLDSNNPGTLQRGGLTLHDHITPLTPGDFADSAGGAFGGNFSNLDSPPVTTGFRKISCLWVNAAYNNYSWGFYMSFGDGEWIGLNGQALVYSASGVLHSGFPLGPFSLSDGFQLPVLIGGGGATNPLAPIYSTLWIDWVRVWQPPSIPIVYAFWNAFDMGTPGGAGLFPTLSQNGYQVTKTGSDTSWQSARAHKYVGYNNVGGGTTTTGGGIISAISAGKWYWEHKLTGNSVGNTSDFILGFGNTAATVVGSYPGSSAKGAGLQYNTAANTNVNGVTGLTASTITWASGDVIGFAFDADAGHVYIHKNGTYINGNPGSGNGVWTVTPGSDAWWPMAAMKTAGSTNAVSSNFGQTAFAFTVPAGYNAGIF